MSKVVLKVENLSKQYQLGYVGTGTLSNDLTRMWDRLRGRGDRFLKIGETNDRATRGKSKYVWAIKDVNFEVKQGEVMAIVGKNGSGKSTLLKILSKVTGPTTGCVKSRGKVSSLLEVGTGFHPELTGVENVFLSGAILGMKQQEIKAKLDEIVAFAEVERYIDTPVKRYSSGMYVRLAFAVAAHLQSDIMIVDEVLAVGDDGFRRKCVDKMKLMTRDGRTILFVSHNMPALQLLCHRGLLLENGCQIMDDDMEKVASVYSGATLATGNKVVNIKTKKDWLSIAAFSIEMDKDADVQPIQFLLDLKVTNELMVSSLESAPCSIDLYIDINNSLGHRLISLRHMGLSIKKSDTKIQVRLEKHFLPKGNYSVTLNLNSYLGHVYCLGNILNFSIFDFDNIGGKSAWLGFQFPSKVKVY